MSEEGKNLKSELPSKSKSVRPPKVPRPASPQPSTSTSTPSTPSTSSGSSTSTSVYSHIEGINDIPRLRSFRPGRRRSIHRLIGSGSLGGKARLAKQYETAIKFLEPIFKEETRRQEEAALYVADAIEIFAATVSGIVDDLEGKTPVNENANKINKLKLKRIQQEVEATCVHQIGDFKLPPERITPPGVEVGEDEKALRTAEELWAAVNAISSGDKEKEKFPTLFTPGIINYLMELIEQDKTPSEDKKPKDKDPAPEDKKN